jgi:HEAT repeat protein
VREAAAWWLRKRPANRELVSRMTTRLAEMPTPTLARNAAEALGHFRDPAAVPVLGRVLADAQKPAEVRRAAAYALGAIGHPEAATALKLALADGSAGVRLQAVRALRLVRTYREAAPLLPLVADGDVLVRRASVLLLGQIRDAQAVPALVAALQGDTDKRVRRQAAWALGRIGDRTAYAALTEAVSRDTDSFVRAQARSALKQLK